MTKLYVLQFLQVHGGSASTTTTAALVSAKMPKNKHAPYQRYANKYSGVPACLSALQASHAMHLSVLEGIFIVMHTEHRHSPGFGLNKSARLTSSSSGDDECDESITTFLFQKFVVEGLHSLHSLHKPSNIIISKIKNSKWLEKSHHEQLSLSYDMTTQQQDLQDALAIFDARFVGMLGIGGIGTVYDVVVNEQHFALKIVLIQNVPRFEHEIAWLREHGDLEELENHVPQLRTSEYLPSGSLAALLSPVGEPVVDNIRQHLPEMCRVVSGLHRAGWQHGDVRIPNFIIAGTTIIIIDFGFVEEDMIEEARYDMYRLAASFLGLDDTSDLDQDAEDLITEQTNFIDTIRDALEIYIDACCSDKAAIEFAHTLLDL